MAWLVEVGGVDSMIGRLVVIRGGEVGSDGVMALVVGSVVTGSLVIAGVLAAVSEVSAGAGAAVVGVEGTVAGDDTVVTVVRGVGAGGGPADVGVGGAVEVGVGVEVFGLSLIHI